MSVGKKSVYVRRLKVYGRGTINLPKEAMQLLGIEPNDELIIIAKDDKAELRKAKSIDELAGSLEDMPISDDELRKLREMAYSGFRCASADACDFFNDIKASLPYCNQFETGELYDGRCYLQLQKGDLRKSIHLAYFETLEYQNGVITINAGIERYVDDDTSKSIINKNKEVIIEAISNLVELQPFDDSGYVLFVEPEFSRSEAALISVVIDRIMRAY